ncbi:MAG: twin-arginine translocase subunit TatC [Deltaproteobacteria bacterium]|jgi:sec-independent protein translocase protein TatC|nr:twin-arginine translocase subunit TatC [Deltaproteobacteria bacterium]
MSENEKKESSGEASSTVADKAADNTADKADGKPAEEQSMSFMDHFKELRSRLIKIFLSMLLGFIICWALRGYIIDFLCAPLLTALRDLGQQEVIIATGVPETFLTYMQIAFISGMFVSSPLIFYQVWAFITPGLYEMEKVFIVPVALASAVFFILGGSFCYFIVFPNALPFLMGFGEEYIHNTPRMSEYYEFTLHLLLAFGLIFEMPLFAFFLARLGIITASTLRRFRRYFIVIAFVVAAIFTPPDVMSQLCMALPMLILYELSIIIAGVSGRKKKAKEVESA